MSSASANSAAVVALWRYPVKSMMGEDLNSLEVASRGIVGDRTYALVDAETGKVASAKNPKKWPGLFDYLAAFCAPPTVYRMLIQKDLGKYNLTLRHCMSAGEPLNPEVIRVWREAFGVEIYDFYGQTETVCIIANRPDFPLRYGSMGKPTPGHDMRIVDDDGQPVPTGEEGNIAIYLGDGRPPDRLRSAGDGPALQGGVRLGRLRRARD